MFIRFNMINERDIHTERDKTSHEGIGRAYALHRATKPPRLAAESIHVRGKIVMKCKL